MFINDKQSTGRISRVVEITPLSPTCITTDLCETRLYLTDRNKEFFISNQGFTRVQNE